MSDVLSMKEFEKRKARVAAKVNLHNLLNGTNYPLNGYTYHKVTREAHTRYHYLEECIRMAKAFGFKNYDRLCQHQDDEITDKMKLLSGPHGLTFLKMFEIQREKIDRAKKAR